MFPKYSVRLGLLSPFARVGNRGPKGGFAFLSLGLLIWKVGLMLPLKGLGEVRPAQGLALGGPSVGRGGRRWGWGWGGGSSRFPGGELRAISVAHPALQGETQALLHN